MKWIEAAIETASGEIDDLCAALTDLGVQGVCIEDEQDFKEFLENNRQYWDYVDEELERRYRGTSRVKFYLSDDAAGRAALENIKAALRRDIEVNVQDDAEWRDGWKQYYQPIEIGERLLVVPDWTDALAEGRAVLRLEPGLAFGTGSHATTWMCLEALDSLDIGGKKVLDIGCGSGILGLAALTLGAAEVTGCDVDPNARTAAERNAALNGVTTERFHINIGNVLTDASLRGALGNNYNIVLANIVADVIITLSAFAADFLAPDGTFICSGIIDNRAAEVKAALRRNGFEIIKEFHEDEWNCFMTRAYPRLPATDHRERQD